MTRTGVYAWHTGGTGVHHHRMAEPLRVLKAHGNHVAYGPELDDHILSTVDTILVHALHYDEPSEAWEKLAQLQTHRLVIDVDDWMWRPDWPGFREHYTPNVLARLFRNVSIAHVVTTPSEVIAEHLYRYNRNTHVVPNTVPAWILDLPAADGALERPAVIYQGSPNRGYDWSGPTTRGLAYFLRDHPDWMFRLYGSDDAGPFARWPQVTSIPWVGNFVDYYRQLQGTVGVGPLRNTPFNRAKSGLRAVEYSALGIVPVLPDMPPYRGWVHNGVTGRLIRGQDTLRAILRDLAADPAQLAELATNARQAAVEWTTEANIGRWLTAWHSR